jgi:transmembrane sensor
MKHYDRYTLEDFVQDPYFREWALGTLEDGDPSWEIWLEENPEKRTLIEVASSMVIGLSHETQEIEYQEIDDVIRNVQRRMNAQTFFWRRWILLTAAALIPILAFFLMWFYSEDPLRTSENTLAREQFESEIDWKSNPGSTPLPIVLADGSLATLSPKSQLGIYSDFGRHSRRILLEGEATFEVVRKPDQPFEVHAHGVITKVLGTVFQIRAWDQDANVSISVKSGKVTVQKETQASQVGESTQEIILTPNQQAVVSRVNDKIIKTVVENPGLIQEPTLHGHFRFTDTPIREVFETLQQAYGIPIDFDENKLAKCNLTAKLADEDLFEQLDMICETIQASYRIADGQILVSGSGCD